MVDALVDKDTAVITFNNRGFEQISEVKRVRGKKREWIRAGAAHERFADSPDDVQGAINYVRRTGVKQIHLAGHSTGAQKSIYWAYKHRGGRIVKSIILFGPLSDYAGYLAGTSASKRRKAVAHALSLVRRGKQHELMPPQLREWFACDAQRFLSLYTPDSAEEIFTYAQPGKNPRALKAARVPILVLLSGADEHTDRPTHEIAAWFRSHAKATDAVEIIPDASHSFTGAERRVARRIRSFINLRTHR